MEFRPKGDGVRPRTLRGVEGESVRLRGVGIRVRGAEDARLTGMGLVSLRSARLVSLASLYSLTSRSEWVLSLLDKGVGLVGVLGVLAKGVDVLLTLELARLVSFGSLSAVGVLGVLTRG